jgi:hypothetical protein
MLESMGERIGRKPGRAGGDQRVGLRSTAKRFSPTGHSVNLAALIVSIVQTDFVLDALEQAIYARCGERLDGLVQHSDRGMQYLSMRYTDRLAEAGIAPSVGSRGDSYENALAESVIGLFKTEGIQRLGPGGQSRP